MVFCVKAQNNGNSPDQSWENVRGELFASYNSEVVSHAAILLGLIVAFPPIGVIAWRRLNDGKKRVSFWGAFIFVSIIFLTLYSFGGLIYWSSMGSSLIIQTRPTNATDVTSFIHIMNANAEANFMNGTKTSLLNSFAGYMRPKFWLEGKVWLIPSWIMLIITIVTPSIILAYVWKPIYRGLGYKQK